MPRPHLLAALAGVLLACPGSTPTQTPTATCDLSKAVPVTHDTVGANEHWATGVHVVPSTVSLTHATDSLTIDPCSEVRLAKDVNVQLREGAQLVAEGTAENPIRFVRLASTDPWGALEAYAPSTISLAYATLEGGGSSTEPGRADYAGATLAADGNAVVGLAPAVLKLAHVTVRQSNGLGVALVDTRFDPASTDLTVTGAGTFPVYVSAGRATELPTGSYTGNATDAILLQDVGPAGLSNSDPITADATLHDRGVPYQVGLDGSDILVGNARTEGPDATLTLEAGVTLRFTGAGSSHSSTLRVRGVERNSVWVPQGTLIVTGTAAKPVTLTSASATPHAGDWMGLYFADVVSPRSRVDRLVVQYAGGWSDTTGVCEASPHAPNYGADCSVILSLDGDLGTSEFITNTQIQHGLGCGFYRGWHGTDTDFRATNTFTDITGCSQSNIPPPGMQTCDSSDCPLP
jgi:hypothetical protein